MADTESTEVAVEACLTSAEVVEEGAVAVNVGVDAFAEDGGDGCRIE